MYSLKAITKTNSYPIHIGPGILQNCPPLQKALKEKQIVVISDETVWPLVSEHIKAPNKTLETICIPSGETSKSLQTIENIANQMISMGCDRETVIVAVGGGVVTDLAGFLASIYQRGIPYISIPTTYLAQVDAAIGGKTAVNLKAGKNLIGSFYPPSLVVSDTQLLQSLPPRELKAGIAEVIKIALIADAALWDWLNEHSPALLAKDLNILAESVFQACNLKQKIVAADYHDHGQRMLLNFGHTAGHVLESLGGYEELLHGEAVAMGMLIELDYAIQKGRVDQSVREKLTVLLQKIGLLDFKLKQKPSFKVVQDLIMADKKKSQNRLRLAIPIAIGGGEVIEVDDQKLLVDLVLSWIK